MFSTLFKRLQREPAARTPPSQTDMDRSESHDGDVDDGTDDQARDHKDDSDGHDDVGTRLLEECLFLMAQQAECVFCDAGPAAALHLRVAREVDDAKRFEMISLHMSIRHPDQLATLKRGERLDDSAFGNQPGSKLRALVPKLLDMVHGMDLDQLEEQDEDMMAKALIQETGPALLAAALAPPPQQHLAAALRPPRRNVLAAALRPPPPHLLAAALAPPPLSRRCRRE